MRQLAEVLREMPDGVYDDLTAQLHEVVAAVAETHKKGSVTLKIDVAPNGETSVFVQANFTAKVPRPSKRQAVFFVDASGNLLRNDPRQPDLPLRAVETKPTTELRDANA